jgi:hypothetical protein
MTLKIISSRESVAGWRSDLVHTLGVQCCASWYSFCWRDICVCVRIFVYRPSELLAIVITLRHLSLGLYTSVCSSRMGIVGFPSHLPLLDNYYCVNGVSFRRAIISARHRLSVTYSGPVSLSMVKHLPPPIKHLLTLRNPSPWPGPPLSNLRKVLTNTLNDAKVKKAETGWLVLAVGGVVLFKCISNPHTQTCTLLTTNRPSAVGYLYRFATRSDPGQLDTRRSITESVNKAALMRESALKSVIFVGVPRVRGDTNKVIH